LNGLELEIGQKAAQLGVGGRLLELPVSFGIVEHNPTSELHGFGDQQCHVLD
jgi:hypothetical protein